MNSERPEILFGKTPRIKTGCGWLYITINYCDSKPFEILPNFGKSGGCGSASAEAIGRMTSLALRKGATIEEVIKELGEISCHLPTPTCKSCYDGVASILSNNKDIPSPLVKSHNAPVLNPDKVDNTHDKVDNDPPRKEW